ncbi:MAG: tRNA (adenosine(37)-N6)-threonylcarbamoyltransferase complex dimerization subunit type 1 TsaB [Spirochaetales bacterium]
MTVLSIDTSTEILSIFCARGEQAIELTRDIDLTHSEQLIPLVDWVLGHMKLPISDIELLVVAEGPGSFTGLRIGLAFVKGLSAAIGCPYVTVPTLDAYASQWVGCTTYYIAPLIDAKKQRFYTALYKGEERVTDYLDLLPQELMTYLTEGSACLLTGPHAKLFYQTQNLSVPPSIRLVLDPYCRGGSARKLASLGKKKYEEKGGASDDAGPLYLRKSDAELSTQKTGDTM